MSDFPTPNVLPTHIGSVGRYGIGMTGRHINLTTVVSRNWVANAAVYIPVAIPFPYPVHRVWWCNGSVLTSSNADFGIYGPDGARLYSTGSTAQSGNSLIQYVTVSTPFILPAGRYYFAWGSSNTTNRSASPSIPTAPNGRLMGLMQEASAIALPATMTPVAWDATLGIQQCGITRTTAGF